MAEMADLGVAEGNIMTQPPVDEPCLVTAGSGITKDVDKSILDEIMRDPEDFKDHELYEKEEHSQERNGAKSSLGMEGATRNEATLVQTAQQDDLTDQEKAEDASSRKSDDVPVTLGHISGATGKAYPVRYFIIKSLNHHNIAKSIERGIWATQQMNEPTLNEAFETADKVILIFSVNMSGHFQGYAQMTSPIGRQRANVWNEGTIGANPWGGTFPVEWLRLYDLPFQMTVHLKNPLNFYKPVKISRDGQELTAEIGAALCALIDEGAERDRLKRKNGSTPVPVSDFSLKRLRGGQNGRLMDGVPRPQFGPPFPYGRRPGMHEPPLPLDPNPMLAGLVTRRDDGPLPVYPAEDVPTSPYPEVFANWGEMGVGYHDARGRFPPVRALSSRSTSLDSDWEGGPLLESDWIGEVEGSQQPLGTYPLRGPVSRRGSRELPEEDLLSMTYEEYLMRVGSKPMALPYEESSRGRAPVEPAYSRGVGRAASMRVRAEEALSLQEQYSGYGALYGKHYQEMEYGNKGFSGREVNCASVVPQEPYIAGWTGFEEGAFAYGGRNNIHY